MVLLTTSSVKCNLVGTCSLFMDSGFLDLPLSGLCNPCWINRSLVLLCHVEKPLSLLNFATSMEMEADYIGLLLMASAGYNPRIAPSVYEKLGKISGESALRDYLSTHPSGKKRAQLLAQAKVMDEALTIYREVQAGKGIEGFL
ncbi:hypothetical protein FXO37_34801 [Capsicum annuum]|nr:hypothetical protein FXO37_34801 [Capsicum annuum]